MVFAIVPYEEASLEELKQGYRFDAERECFCCLHCGARYADGEIFPQEGRLLDARRAVREHISGAHGSAFDALLREGKKATGLSEIQSGLMKAFYDLVEDKEIARRTKTSHSTVRYQRHALRERAKQAKAFLALWALTQERLRLREADELVEIHSGATMVDERYMVTQAEAEAIQKTSFSSLVPLKLKALSPKEKKKLVILRTIAGEFKKGERYSGKQVDEILGAVHDDYATLRRYLIEYGFMDRTADGREYWLL